MGRNAKPSTGLSIMKKLFRTVVREGGNPLFDATNVVEKTNETI